MMWTFRDVVFIAETGGIRGYDPLFQGGFLLVGVATCAIITAAVHPRSFVGNAVLGNPVFTYIGRRSYGLYLFHWPVFQLYRKVASNNLTFIQFVLLFAVVLVLTELSYRFIEMPVREGRLGEAWHKLRFPRTDADNERRNKVFALGAVVAVLPVFSIVSLAIGTGEGKLQRASRAVKAWCKTCSELRFPQIQTPPQFQEHKPQHWTDNRSQSLPLATRSCWVLRKFLPNAGSRLMH